MISNHRTITWLWHNDPCQPLYDFILAEDNIVWLSRPRQYENWILLWKFAGTTPVWKRDFVIIIQFESWICCQHGSWFWSIRSNMYLMANERSRQYGGLTLWPWKIATILVAGYLTVWRLALIETIKHADVHARVECRVTIMVIPEWKPGPVLPDYLIKIVPYEYGFFATNDKWRRRRTVETICHANMIIVLFRS